MSGRPSTVTCELQLRLVLPGQSSVPLAVVLHYSAGDPYAVHADFRTSAEESVEWVFARELLAEGVRRPTGEGDVRVWPSTEDEPPVVYLALTSPDGQALLHAPVEALTGFLHRTYELVPPGLESVDIDATVQALLAS